MKKTAIINLSQYLKGSYPIGVGTTAICFLMKDGRILKVFLNNYNKNNLFNSYKNIIGHFERINSLKNDTYVTPEEIIIKDGKCVGYIYKYVNSRTLKHIKSNAKINYIIDAYDKLYNDTKEISNKKFCLFDVHDRNILFNVIFKIIDLDKGIFEDKMNADDILKENMRVLNKTILYSLLKINDDQIINFKDEKLNELYIKKVLKDYKGMKSFLEDLQEYNKDIRTVYDIKKNSKKLVYSVYNDYYRHY